MSKKTKRVIRCKFCNYLSKYIPLANTFICHKHRIFVTENDGCTMGYEIEE